MSQPPQWNPGAPTQPGPGTPGQGYAFGWKAPPPAAKDKPSLLQSIGYWTLWAGIVGVPLMVLAIRFGIVGSGWLTFIFVLFGVAITATVQIFLGICASIMTTGWSRPAMGRIATICSFAYYACWAVVALSFGDVGDDSSSEVPSPFAGVLGETGAATLGMLGAGVGIVALICTVVFIFIEGAAQRRRWAAAASGTNSGVGRQ